MNLLPYSSLPRRTKPLRWRRKPSRITKDGRIILNAADYHLLRVEKCIAAAETCQNRACGKYTPLERGELHHIGGRGLGGSKHDDTKEKTFWSCKDCHMAEHGQAWAK